MSNRGIYTKFVRDMIKFAKPYGFEPLGVARSGHFKLRHRDSGRVVTMAVSPSNQSAERMARRDVLRAAGVIGQQEAA